MAILYDGEQYLVEKYAVALSLGLQLLAPKPLTQKKTQRLSCRVSATTTRLSTAISTVTRN